MIYLVSTTAPNASSAQKISKKLLSSRLAACVHISPAGVSHYWWKGKIEKARENVLTIKTSKKSLPSLLQTLKKIHPYEIPEILVLRADHGNSSYMKWVVAETRGKP